MKLASGSRKLTAVAAALFVMVAFGACKSKLMKRESESWRRGTAGMSKMEVRWLESQMASKRQKAAMESGDEDADYDLLNFDQKVIGEKKGNPFGSNIVKNKAFGTKDFAGADEYKYGDYQFLKRQDFKAKTSSDQNQMFVEGDSESGLLKRRFAWQRKQARTGEFNQSDKRAHTGDEYQPRNISTGGSPNIVRDLPAEDGATLTVDDVRSILGKD